MSEINARALISSFARAPVEVIYQRNAGHVQGLPPQQDPTSRATRWYDAQHVAYDMDADLMTSGLQHVVLHA